MVHDNALVRHSYLFVDFFFVLSGFIISVTQERRPDPPGRFIWKRIARIWPLHAAMLGVFVAFSLSKGDFNADEQHSALAIVTNLLMVHAWGVHGALTWNDPSWSISVEWFLYLLFAALALVSAGRARLLTYAGLVAAGILTLFFFAPSGMGSTFDFGIARGLAGFFMGALIARAPLRPFGTGAELAAVLGVVTFVASGVAPYVASFVFGAAVYVFAGSQGLVGRALLWRPFVLLGALSYSIYMIHAAAIAAIWGVGARIGWVARDRGLDAGPWGDPLAAVYIAAIIAVAAVSYFLFEDPVRRALTGRRQLAMTPA